ncbi:MAG: ArsR/SmtB family transcription factor [Acetanaerobacterium sp.]
MENEYEQTARVFKALCDPNRLMIIEMLQSGEKCACKLLDELDIVQSTLSHHMKILCDSGFVSGRRDGKWMHYSLSGQGCSTAMELLHQITAPAAQEVKAGEYTCR